MSSAFPRGQSPQAVYPWSGVHATLKLDAGQLYVRDENSNNGTFVDGHRLAPGVWTVAPAGTAVRFGPVEFGIRIE